MSRWSKSILLPAAVFCTFSCWTLRAEPARHGSAAVAARHARGAGTRTATQSDAADATLSRALLDRYCVGCHNVRTKAGGLTLDTADPANVGAAPRTWENVVRKLRDRAMPPAGAPRPDAAGYDRLASYFETRLDAAGPNAGRPVVRRLNRVEYTHAIRDLLDLDVDGAALLPADESGYGFDNIGDVLSISPALLERYMFAAQKISALAVGDPAMKPVVTTYRISPAVRQDRRMSDELPFRSRGGAAIRHYFPADGDYTLKLKLRRAFSNAGIIGYNTRERLDVRVDDEQVKLFAIGGECLGAKAHEPQCVILPGVQTSSDYSIHLDDGLDVRVHVKAGEHRIGASFAQSSSAATEGAGRGGGFGGPMALDRVVVEGPTTVDGVGETPSRARIFVCRSAREGEEVGCADRILSTLARRAYRRPVTREDVAKLMAFYKDARRAATFDEGVRFAIERLLVSPNFLLRVEHDQAKATPGTPYRVTDLELASRLSFFLWSTIPDEELLNVAAAGRLSDPKTLEQQVRRMLADRRSSELVTDFAAQWLYLRDLRKLVPDPIRFPEFTDNLRDAFLRETQMFLESEMRDNQPVPHLLTADYTFANEELAKFYGIPNVYGTHFRRVAVSDPNRAGLLGNGSVLTVTSYATRTSPVQRGKYILANILGTPPPPPPPDVPTLPDLAEGAASMSMRDRMAAHRRNPVCASCHTRMDPLGFALENFNAIGKWRSRDGDALIDPSGAFPDGTTFAGPAEFRGALLSHQDQFVRTFAEKLLTYALGRGLDYYDMPAVRGILRDAASADYRWSSVVLAVVKSMPFRMRTAYDASERAVTSTVGQHRGRVGA
jgi:mono/diheme cytochrome c family protein